MRKDLFIIFGILSFFVGIGALAWYASDGNAFCSGVLHVLGFLLLFYLFIVLPSVKISAILSRWMQFRARIYFVMFALTLFWVAVFTTVNYMPEWGWNFVEFFGKSSSP